MHPRSLASFVLLFALAATCHSQETRRPSGLAERIKLYSQEAAELSPEQIYDAIQAIRQTISSRNSSVAVDLASPPTEDEVKALGYERTLKRLAEENNLAALFLHGMVALGYCEKLQSFLSEEDKRKAVTCFAGAIDPLRKASSRNHSLASFSLGRIYESGLGVSKSRLVAADYFILAARQSVAESDRISALRAVEAALNAVPDHPAALKLRAGLLN